MNNGFLTIEKLCQRVEIKSHTLRYWEKEFSDFLKPHRTKGGRRRCGDNDLKKLLEIKKLVKDKGYTIEGARKALHDSE